MRFLVTAGSTRQPIDRVRDWGNIFTGATGLAIALELASVGEVDLLTANAAHRASPASMKTAHRIDAAPFLTHGELREALAMRMTHNRYDAVFMTAAVSDYSPAGAYAIEVRHADPGDPDREHWIVRNVQAGKVKSAHDRIAFLGERTEKLVDLFRTEWRFTGLLVKFKLEVGLSPDDLIAVGQASRLASGADHLVANTLDMVSGPNAGCYLISGTGHRWIPRGELAVEMRKLVEDRWSACSRR